MSLIPALKMEGSLEHMQLHFNCLYDSRLGVLDLWRRKLQDRPQIREVFIKYTITEPSQTVQFLLDPSVLPDVVIFKQTHSKEDLNTIFTLTRTYCATLHKAKMKLLGII